MDYTYTVCSKCSRSNRIPAAGPQGKKPVCGACGEDLPVKGLISEVSASGLRALVESSPLPVVADFWAPWCGPCRMFAPTFEEASRDLAGQVVFAKVNTEVHPLASQAYSIRGIPTLILFQGGKEIRRVSGALPREQLDQFLGVRPGAHAGKSFA